MIIIVISIVYLLVVDDTQRIKEIGEFSPFLFVVLVNRFPGQFPATRAPLSSIIAANFATAASASEALIGSSVPM